MRSLKFKKLTLISIALAIFSALPTSACFAAIFKQESFKTHLRWKIAVPKDQVLITKYPTYVKIETLNPKIFKDLEKQLKVGDFRGKYVTDIRSSKKEFPRKAAKIIVNLRSSDIELFTFYKQKDEIYIMDFWDAKEQEKSLDLSKKKAPKKKKIVKQSPKSTLPIAASSAIAPQPKTSVTKKKKESGTKPSKVKQRKPTKISSDRGFRDFRYGAAFIWDYGPILPNMTPLVNVNRKTPEFFYPINDREFDKNEQESHLQLTVNLFRKKKYGLMYKSIKLFEKKYGEHTENELLDYMKANALLRESKNNDDQSIEKSAINLFINIAERSENYELKKGIYRYLIEYTLKKKDFIQALQYTKNFYLLTKKNFDIELNQHAAEIILFCLANMNQVEKIEQFIDEPTIKKLLPKQRLLAFKSFALLKRGRTKELIRDYKKSDINLQKSIDPALLYNTAEAYFRNADFKNAVKLFDKFVGTHSHYSEASYARLRIALAYEILGREEKTVLELYKNSIDRAVLAQARLEAKLRYVGLLLARKMKPTKKDGDSIVFLDHSPEERPHLKGDMKKLLWLVRLRTLINQRAYKKALAYLNSLPLDAMNSAERRTFDGDGAEIVYGLISDAYAAGEYAKTLKIWELFKEKYVSKVASDPYLNFVINNCYLKMKLFDSFDRGIERFKKINKFSYRQYPVWVSRKHEGDPSELLSEAELLRLMHAKDWQAALVKVKKLSEANNKKNYYLSVVSEKLGNHAQAVKHAEQFLVRGEDSRNLSDEELANFLMAFSNALYQQGELDRFKIVTKALLTDIRKSKLKNKFLKQADEKLTYLFSEVLAGENKSENYLSLEPMISGFLDRHKQSIYFGRMNYLYGVSLANNKKEKKAMSVFEKLLKDNSIPSYIKELARTEISSIRLKNRSI